MESNALIGIIGGILVCLLTLLIAMLFGLKADISKIWDKLDDLVPVDTYKDDQERCRSATEKIKIRLDKHARKILIIEMTNGIESKEDDV
jgi:hypothetical protein